MVHCMDTDRRMSEISFTHGVRKAIQKNLKVNEMKMRELEEERKRMVRGATVSEECIFTLGELTLPAYIEGDYKDETRCILSNFPELNSWVKTKGRHPHTNERCSTSEIRLLDSSRLNRLKRETVELTCKMEELKSKIESQTSTIESQEKESGAMRQLLRSKVERYDCTMCEKCFEKDTYGDAESFRRAYEQHLRDKHHI